ncbi:hypothetical protein Bxe_C0149 [Paraburkholderia xenovorans LB400]|uniref:Uncharacterized protein n=1 Tax=Paraburkholderia xenovorans (strain LB400) TaxID=266265 RepID=Q13IL5_PARXL|nr:hypothetical protein Bxe_C0149 [Paraburkholderia xenovorans LB400]
MNGPIVWSVEVSGTSYEWQRRETHNFMNLVWPARLHRRCIEPSVGSHQAFRFICMNQRISASNRSAAISGSRQERQYGFPTGSRGNLSCRADPHKYAGQIRRFR